MKQPQRRRLSLPRTKKGSNAYRAPCYNVYYNILQNLDLDAFASVHSEWLQQTGTLPASLAMDGKMVRDTVGLLSLVEHDTGTPVAVARISKKDGEGKRCEMKVAPKVVRNAGKLDGKIVTADALHCQTNTAMGTVEEGGDYLVQVKGNRKKLRLLAKKKMHDVPSRPAHELSPQQWLELIRGHWGGIEIRNHWRKDACWLEDKTRGRNTNIVGALCLLRNALLAIFA